MYIQTCKIENAKGDAKLHRSPSPGHGWKKTIITSILGQIEFRWKVKANGKFKMQLN